VEVQVTWPVVGAAPASLDASHLAGAVNLPVDRDCSGASIDVVSSRALSAR
jgi:hypothetical protein